MTAGDVTWAELISQPDVWKALIARLEAGGLTLPVALEDYDEILLLGSGTSYYLALAVADWLRRRRYRVRAVPSCEVLLDAWETHPSDTARLAVGFSRSGESSELILADSRLRAAGFTTIGVSCTAGSSLIAQADHPMLIEEGFEDGLVMLRSFTSMLIAWQWLTGRADDRAALARLPDAGRAMIATHAQALRDLANLRSFDRFVFLGSGPSHPLALESGLKIQEMAIATSEAYHSLDYRHGPKACADAQTLVCLFTLSDRDHGLALARDVKALGAALLVVGPDADAYDKVADLAVSGPADVEESPAAALMMLPAQMFAFATARRRGQNPDAPVNLSKVVVF